MTDTPKTNAPKKKTKRDPQETQERLLQAATQEFCDNGFEGARIDRIVKAAGCNIRMLYHYFQDKEGLYLAVLEQVYGELRAQEQTLELEHLEPAEAIKALLHFTFDYMVQHPEFIAFVRNENLLAGRMLEKSTKTIQATTPLISSIENILREGTEQGVFHQDIDACGLYLTILSLSMMHLSNRHTLSILFKQDLADPHWLAERRKTVEQVVMSYLLDKESESFRANAETSVSADVGTLHDPL